LLRDHQGHRSPSVRAEDALSRYGQDLDPAVLRDLKVWEHHPELGRLISNLQSHANRKAFFDTLAEAMVARHLLGRGCELRFELPTPAGRHSDFEVKRDGLTFYLHVKRVDTDRPPHNPARLLTVSSKLRILEKLPRPYVVQVRFHEGLSDEQMLRLVQQSEQFITHARVGDEMKSRDHDGREMGGVRIVAPHEHQHVSVTIGLPSGFVDQAPRFRKLMHRAHQQFMPRQTNVIVIGSGHPDDGADFDTALQGTHVERWDAYPPRGKRVAHGRAADGFWHGHRFLDSRYAGWFQHGPGDYGIRSRLWLRKRVNLDDRMSRLLEELFAGKD